MSYIRFESRHLGNALWLDATPEAFTVHAWALDYCNEQATDGHIPTKVAHRLNCPVEPADIPAAFQCLVDLGFWERDDTGYQALEFLAHGIAAEEQHETRKKWAEDKRRRNLHAIGNHQLCTERSKCQVKGRSGNDSTSNGVGSTNPPVEKWTTRPNQTRPYGVGDGEVGTAGPAAVAASADAPATPAATPPDDFNVTFVGFGNRETP